MDGSFLVIYCEGSDVILLNPDDKI